MNTPEELKYTRDHEWVRAEGDILTIGITDFAQSELGDIVYIDIEGLDETLDQNEVFGSVEAVKALIEDSKSNKFVALCIIKSAIVFLCYIEQTVFDPVEVWDSYQLLSPFWEVKRLKLLQSLVIQQNCFFCSSCKNVSEFFND